MLVVWVLWGFKMGFGTPWHGLSSGSGSFFGNFIGKPGPVLSHTELQHQASIPLIGSMAFPKSALVYFQLVFAAITPILALGSVLGRVNFKAWIPFCALWITCVYAVDAFLIWGGGYFAHHGAVDFSGGYVIHLSAGVAGFVAAAVIGPRLQRDREIDAPNNVAMVAVGAGLLWLGWNGFNGGDPVRLEHERGRRRAEHEPVHCRRAARLDRLGLHHRAQAVAHRQRQWHDRRSGGDHAGGRLRQRLGRDRDRGDRLDARVLRAQLPEPDAALPPG